MKGVESCLGNECVMSVVRQGEGDEERDACVRGLTGLA